MLQSLLESVIVYFHSTEAYSSLDWPKQNTAWVRCQWSRRKILQCELSLTVSLQVNKGNQHDHGKIFTGKLLIQSLRNVRKYRRVYCHVVGVWMSGFIDTLYTRYYLSQTTTWHTMSSFLNHLRLPPQETPSIIPQLSFLNNSSSINSSTQSTPPLNGLNWL
jgi:hypothetical protein